MKISQNTTAIDVAFNLSGSLTGFPAILNQIPESKPIGFDEIPPMWDDVDIPDQTWTPSIEGKVYDFSVPLYNTLGQAKAPYTTPLLPLTIIWEYGNLILEEILVSLEPFNN